MGMIERFGGIWFEQMHATKILICETYDPVLDAILSIHQRRVDGHFEVAFWQKSPDPQWSLPLWNSVANHGLFGTLEDAQAHLQAIRDQYMRSLSVIQ